MTRSPSVSSNELRFFLFSFEKEDDRKKRNETGTTRRERRGRGGGNGGEGKKTKRGGDGGGEGKKSGGDGGYGQRTTESEYILMFAKEKQIAKRVDSRTVDSNPKHTRTSMCCSSTLRHRLCACECVRVSVCAPDDPVQ